MNVQQITVADLVLYARTHLEATNVSVQKEPFLTQIQLLDVLQLLRAKSITIVRVMQYVIIITDVYVLNLMSEMIAATHVKVFLVDRTLIA